MAAYECNTRKNPNLGFRVAIIYFDLYFDFIDIYLYLIAKGSFINRIVQVIRVSLKYHEKTDLYSPYKAVSQSC